MDSQRNSKRTTRTTSSISLSLLESAKVWHKLLVVEDVIYTGKTEPPFNYCGSFVVDLTSTSTEVGVEAKSDYIVRLGPIKIKKRCLSGSGWYSMNALLDTNANKAVCPWAIICELPSCLICAHNYLYDTASQAFLNVSCTLSPSP